MRVRWVGAMSLAELDHIRALLVAQTAEPEPQGKSLLGRLFAPKAERSRPPPPPPRFATVLDLAATVEAATVEPDLEAQDPERHPEADAEIDAETGAELLLEQLCRPNLEVETASPLPPPAPRGEFGRRADIALEPELILDQPAVHARRLQLLDPSGQPVGEMILRPDEPPMRVIATVVREEVPYFPEDFLDPDHPAEPQPLRPWLKALRKSGVAQPALAAAQTRDAGTADAAPDESAPLTKRVRNRRAQGRQSQPQSQPKAPPQPLSHDLLEALAFTLSREHENLADRLLSVAGDSVFRQAMAESEAA